MAKLERRERESEALEAQTAAFDAMFPYVRGNPFIPHWPFRNQLKLLGAHLAAPDPTGKVFECLYGGAVGGGKSDALLMAIAQYAWQHGDFAAVAFRKSYPDLINPGSLLDRALAWWRPQGVHWSWDTMTFTFPSGAKCRFSHMQRPDSHYDHLGAEYQLTVWDELTQHDKTHYEGVGLMRIRRNKSASVPLRTLSASNPGGKGHDWVKRRFMGGKNEATGVWEPPLGLYIPSRLQDNPHIDSEPYIASLMHLHPTTREQYLNGDWSARDPGDYFRREWFGPMLDPEEDAWPQRDKITVRWWDLAASEKEDAARTAGVKMSRHRSGVRAVEHAVAFRATPGARDAKIIQMAQADGRHVYVGLEIEPGSGGLAQFENLSKQLAKKGFRAVGARPKAEMTKAEGKTLVRQTNNLAGKAGRASPVASCLERGYQRRGECQDTGQPEWGQDAERAPWAARDGLRIYAGPWTHAYLDELEGFPDVDLLDFADATSGGWAWLEAHPFGAQVPPGATSRPEPRDGPDVHPQDRPEPGQTGGYWTP